MSTPIIRGETWRLAFGPESAYGDDPGTAAIKYNFGVVQSGTMPDPEYDWQPIWALGNASKRDFYINYKGKITLTGGIPDVWLLNGYPLYFPIGAVVTTGEEAPYTHTISEASQLSSITMQHELFDSAGNSELIRRFSGGKINRASYSASEGEQLRMGIDEIIFNSYAKTGDSGIATDVASYPTTEPYLFSTGSLSIFGSEFARIKSFVLDVSNNIEPKYYISNDGGERLPLELREGHREYRLGLTVDIEDSTIFDELIKEGVEVTTFTGFDVSIVFTRGANDTITFTMPPSAAAVGGDAQGCLIRSAPHNIVGEPQVSVDLDVIVRSLKIVVVDDIEVYPGE